LRNVIYIHIYIKCVLPTATNVNMAPRSQALCSLALAVLVYSMCLYIDYRHKNRLCTTYILFSNVVVTLPCIVVRVRTCRKCFFPEPKRNQIINLRLYFIKQVLLMLTGFGISVNSLSIIAWPYTLQKINNLQCGPVVDSAIQSVVAIVTYTGLVILILPSVAYIWKSVLWNLPFPCPPCCHPCLTRCSQCSQPWNTTNYRD
jgi:hypothetical protein